MTLVAGFAQSALGQKPEARIVAPVDNATRATLSGTRPPMAQAANDAGRMTGTTPLQQMTMIFSRSAAQQTALDALIAAQQNPASAQFHQWLSPDEFAAEFGAADADIAKVQAWLQSQGFTVGEVSRSRMEIAFSGTIAQVEAAFGTEMHYFKNASGETHFAPATDLSVPVALAAAVMGVGHLTDQRPHSHMRPMAMDKVNSHFTSGQSGNTFTTPGDVAVIYDINAAYSAGYTGTGQTIAVVGQSAVLASDITNFQNASGTPVRAPALNLIPSTGASQVNTGDESESDLDLEYSGAIGKGATIAFYYTGNASNSGGAFYALQYAIQNKVAPIISNSYGDCEIDLGQTNYSSMNAYLQQAAAQGQTVIAAAGDQGSTDCFEISTQTTANRTTLSVDWPASSQYVTAMGGTEFLAADVTVGQVVGANSSQYWTSNGTTDVITSAKSYIPEMVWNDDAPFVSNAVPGGISSGGGGVSIYTPRPSWQIGVPGITAGTFRLVPDISLASSPNNAGYLYCTSDSGNTGITGSCTTGFRDATNTNLTVAGGTSFAVPIFAGMLAIINQKTNTNYGGLVNPTLYSLAANASTYGTAFHDITSGSNACTAGTTYCLSPGTTAYSATTGYDQASGIGSLDLFNLLSSWANNLALTGSTTTVTAASTTPTPGTTDTITFKAASANSGVTATPTGSVNVSVDGGYVQTVSLVNGTATYTYTATAGTHVIDGVYAGDTTFAASMGSTSVTVAYPPGTFTIAATTLPVTDGSTATETITVTPTGGFTGAVNLSLTTTATIANACYTVTAATITGTTAATATATIYTNGSSCPGGANALLKRGATKSAEAPAQPIPGHSLPVGLAMAGLLAVGFAGRRSRRLRGLVVVALLAAGGFAMSGCGSTSTAGEGISTTAPKGTYTVTVTGTDAASGLKTASTTFTLTIQ